MSEPAIPNPTYVSETLLKKRKLNEKNAAIKARERIEKKKSQKKLRKQQFKRADEFIRQHMLNEKQARRLNAVSSGKMKGTNSTKKPKDAGELLFVARIKTQTSIHPKIKKLLTQFRLLKMNSGVFIVCKTEIMKDLRKIEPFVTYGRPTLKTVRDLIMKRGATMIKGVRTPLSDNTMIEEQLGNVGVICLEDIVHEIWNHENEETFNTVNKFLLPFQLNDPVRGWRQKKLKEILNREDDEENEAESKRGSAEQDDINQLVAEMN
ncbi:60S ribosomal protein L7 [Mycotypha africana]|uniref:60S ribosomal protein L7 n=1 Tax=Mycotypha africana TaxID=64632 RepID=UPI0023013D40|nr:60S ribosomal protein L7 [Mycotypha africana]KAI8987929.1 60S ribosomal protein L7 [Mycotypha africana]